MNYEDLKQEGRVTHIDPPKEWLAARQDKGFKEGVPEGWEPTAQEIAEAGIQEAIYEPKYTVDGEAI